MISQLGKLKVMTVVGTRPEIIRLSRIIPKLDHYLNQIIVFTSQSYDYELSTIFFKELGLRKPDYVLTVMAETLGSQIGNILIQTEAVMVKEKPDAVLILGDTNSALSAIIAKRLKIPIFHMEAGNRCFDENVPEEINRKIIDHISDVNLPYSENARLYLIEEGIHPGTIYVTGSPLAEVLVYYKENIDSSRILKKLKLKKNKYFVASLHREENVANKKALRQLIDAFNTVAKNYQLPIIVTTHPRTAKHLKEYKLKPDNLLNLQKPFGYFDYVHLQKNAFCVLSDSGTILEECSMVGFAAIQVRTSSERPEAYDEGVAILSGLNPDIILQSIDIVTKQLASGEKFNLPLNYRDLNVSSKVLRLIVGLTKIIKEKR